MFNSKTVRLFAILAVVFALIFGSNVVSPARAAGPWYVSPGGSDTINSGTDVLSPFQTIQHAIDVASDGDTINVGAGTYTAPSEY